MMAGAPTGRVAITGALSFTGRYLATHLLNSAKASSVLNLSSRKKPISSHNLSENHLDKIASHELCFDDALGLTKALGGVDVLYCTYWIRFARDGDTHEKAADRCRVLFECAREAGVKKVVFSAHTGMSHEGFPYIDGKARACQHLRDLCASSSMKYAIVKPCGIFGDVPNESILFNNAAYVLRRTPLFILPRDGLPKFQPIHVQDMAQLMAEIGSGSIDTSGEELDAVGSDSPTGLELFRCLRDACGGSAMLCSVVPSYLPSRFVGALTKPLDWMTGDVLLDSDDLDLMYSGLTVADDPTDPRIKGRRGVLQWMKEHGPNLGRKYVSSIARYYYPRQQSQ
uniref:NAD-dependent epimerase/dehydratase domain-containing protein n=1 Tax=Trieres chinensis TaxID=1514140 RepID=A0A7S2ET71_TRICV|mmetsp:Transcript_38367/g.78274  ORF Transcript_38367/g.78274 Transcript_38367/m.78274 type:complete len:341 (+) Transcript_38367:63-1085(+)